ncbi:MAG: MFS transporter [Candidatus Omnitrophota bacterium]
MVRFRDVLFKRNFFSLWTGQIISEFGDRLNQMALISLVCSKAPGSVIALAKLLFFIVIPVFIIGPVAGVYIDRWDRKKVMVFSDILRGVLVLFIPVFIHFKLMPLVYATVFLMFSATRFFIPSKLAFIPAIVSKEKLVVANSLSNTTRMIATILGFAAAGFIVKWIGHIWGFYLDGLSYFISAGLIASITAKGKKESIKEELIHAGEVIESSIRKNVWNEIKEGMGHMFHKDRMKIVTSTMFLLMAGAGAVFCIIIVFVQETFGSVTEDLGKMGVFLGVGLFLGTILYGKLGQKFSKIHTMFICFTLCGAGVAAFTLYAGSEPVFLIGALLIMFIGAVTAPILTCTNTLIHVLIPDEVRGRIFSSLEAVMHLAFLMFMFITAYLTKYYTHAVILLTCGTFFMFTGIIGRVLTRKEIT